MGGQGFDGGGDWLVTIDKIRQKMLLIKGKNGYLVLSFVKNLLFYHNFSPKHVFVVKSFKHK